MFICMHDRETHRSFHMQWSHSNLHLQDAGHTAEQHIKSSEDIVLAGVRDRVKSSLQWCKDYPLFSYTGAALIVLSFPAPRAFLLRNVFGVFQSQVGVLQAIRLNITLIVALHLYLLTYLKRRNLLSVQPARSLPVSVKLHCFCPRKNPQHWNKHELHWKH